MSRSSSIGAVSTAPYGHRTTSPARDPWRRFHQWKACPSPQATSWDEGPPTEAPTSRGHVRCWRGAPAIGLGCRKNGCGVWCARRQKDLRAGRFYSEPPRRRTRPWPTRQPRQGTPPRPPARAGVNESGLGREIARTTTSTPGGNGVGGRASERVRGPRAALRRSNSLTTARPMRPDAPTTRTGAISDIVIARAPAVEGAASRGRERSTRPASMLVYSVRALMSASSVPGGHHDACMVSGSERFNSRAREGSAISAAR